MFFSPHFSTLCHSASRGFHFLFNPGHLCAIGLVRGSDLSLSELCLFSICLPLHQRYIQAGPYAFISHMPFAHLPRGFASVYGLVILWRWKEGSTFLHVCYFTLPCPKIPDGLPVLSFSLICWSDPSNAVSSMSHTFAARKQFTWADLPTRLSFTTFELSGSIQWTHLVPPPFMRFIFLFFFSCHFFTVSRFSHSPGGFQEVH